MWGSAFDVVDRRGDEEGPAHAQRRRAQREQRALGHHLRVGVALHQRLAAGRELAECASSSGARDPRRRSPQLRGDAAAQPGRRRSRAGARAASCASARAPRYSSAQSSSAGSEAPRSAVEALGQLARARGSSVAASAGAGAERARAGSASARSRAGPAALRATSTSSVRGGGSSSSRSSAFCASWFSHSASAITATRRPPSADAQAQRGLERADLADPHARVVGAALDPEQVRVIADVAQQRALLAGAVEREDLAPARATAGRTRLARARRRPAADDAAREPERGLARPVAAGRRAGRRSGADRSRGCDAATPADRRGSRHGGASLASRATYNWRAASRRPYSAHAPDARRRTGPRRALRRRLSDPGQPARLPARDLAGGGGGRRRGSAGRVHGHLGPGAARVPARRLAAERDGPDRLAHADRGHVHPRRTAAPGRQPALPVDLRTSHRAPARPRPLPALLPGVRPGCVGRPGRERLRIRTRRSSAPAEPSRACSAATRSRTRPASCACSGRRCGCRRPSSCWSGS